MPPLLLETFVPQGEGCREGREVYESSTWFFHLAPEQIVLGSSKRYVVARYLPVQWHMWQEFQGHQAMVTWDSHSLLDNELRLYFFSLELASTSINVNLCYYLSLFRSLGHYYFRYLKCHHCREVDEKKVILDVSPDSAAAITRHSTPLAPLEVNITQEHQPVPPKPQDTTSPCSLLYICVFSLKLPSWCSSNSGGL